MKTEKLLLIVASMIGMIFIVGWTYTSSKNVDVKSETIVISQPSENSMAKDTNKMYAKFKASAERQIAENKKKIIDLNKKIETKSQDVRAKLEQKITDLAAQNQELEKKLEQYKEESKETWSAFKKDFSDEMDKLKKALGDFEKDMK